MATASSLKSQPASAAPAVGFCNLPAGAPWLQCNVGASTQFLVDTLLSHGFFRGGLGSVKQMIYNGKVKRVSSGTSCFGLKPLCLPYSFIHQLCVKGLVAEQPPFKDLAVSLQGRR